MGYPSNKFYVYSKNSTKTNPSSLTHSVLIEQIAPKHIAPSLGAFSTRVLKTNDRPHPTPPHPQIPSLCVNNFIFTGFYSIFCVASSINNFAK